ncbi:MAG: hypothetical protein PUD38_03755 [Firmicutes bacterium]|nr:hypothetical protein [Bacillota bacterium]
MRDFDPSESMENAGILDVFPIFRTARLGQKIRRSPQLPPSGAALSKNPVPLMALCQRNRVFGVIPHLFHTIRLKQKILRKPQFSLYALFSPRADIFFAIETICFL